MDTGNNKRGENNARNTNNEKSNEVVRNDNANNKFLDFVKKNIVAVVLGVILLVGIIWYLVRISTMENQFEQERTALVTQHEAERDSIQIRNLESESRIFSWSVRSELMRNNTENLDQLINAFVRESRADLVQLIDPETNVITLSSDKKFEGTQYDQNIDHGLTEPRTVREEGGIRITTPVMGLNNPIGILIVEMR